MIYRVYIEEAAVDLDVEYTYIAGRPATDEAPPEAGELEIDSVTYNGHDVSTPFAEILMESENFLDKVLEENEQWQE